jgi:hypothetical protein
MDRYISSLGGKNLKPGALPLFRTTQKRTISRFPSDRLRGRLVPSINGSVLALLVQKPPDMSLFQPIPPIRPSLSTDSQSHSGPVYGGNSPKMWGFHRSWIHDQGSITTIGCRMAMARRAHFRGLLAISEEVRRAEGGSIPTRGVIQWMMTVLQFLNSPRQERYVLFVALASEEADSWLTCPALPSVSSH